MTKPLLAVAVAATLMPMWLLAADTNAPVEQAMLRITCEGESADAAIHINGKFKGNCPIDAQVPAGYVFVRAVKKVGADRERIYEKELRLGGDVVGKVEVKLWQEAHLSAQTVKRLSATEEQEALLREAKQREQLPAIIRSAEGGDVTAMFRLGQIYDWGLAGPMDFVKAAMWYGRAVDKGHTDAMMAYTGYLMSGKAGVPIDIARATALRDQAAAAGNSGAMYAMSIQYRYSLDASEQTLANEWKQKAAAAGNCRAMEDLGYEISKLANAQSEVATRYVNEGVSCLRRAAADGDSDAAITLANNYSIGLYPTVKDIDESDRLFRQVFRDVRKGAETGDITALMKLAARYKSGSYGAPKDRAMAIKLYKQAKDKGSVDAVVFLRELEEE